MKKVIIGVVQIAALTVVAMLGNYLVTALHLGIPGSILGIIILFSLLQLKVIRMEWLESGANWLLAELLLFFVPSAVGIIKYKDFMMEYGIRLAIIITLSTFIVMASTGISAEIIARFRGQKSQ